MPITTRTFRVFVSSTFEDLEKERNALAAPRGPFAELATDCEKFGARFQAIDLRWGVREEAAHDQRTMEMCLGEIDRCQRTGVKPNFIILLGDRYGWRPVPACIKATEFHVLRDWIGNDSDMALVDDWYRLDSNAVPPEFVLKARSGEFKDKDRWGATEAVLHKVLRDAARAAGLNGDARSKYEVSATHQEILKGLGTAAEDRNHIFAFFRTSQGASEDPELLALKQYLRDELKGNVFEARNTQELCGLVRDKLGDVIKAEAECFTSRLPLEIEAEANSVFARDRARHFRGRKDVLASIDRYIQGSHNRLLVIHGSSGSGKSAIMARASDFAIGHCGAAAVIRRFIGTTPGSSNGLALLESICEEIDAQYNTAGEIPVDFESVVRGFRERLAQATAEQPLILFLDALDQISPGDPAATIAWLVCELPAHCRIVVSTTDDVRSFEGAIKIELESLPADDAQDILDLWLHDARRTLQQRQRAKLLDFYSRCRLPLYLKLAFEEAKRWRSFDLPENCVLGEGIAEIIHGLFERLSSGSDHGEALVRRSLGYLVTSRYGLTESEMIDLLTWDEDVWNEFNLAKRHDPPGRHLPVILWSRLFFDLEPYLMERAVPGGVVFSFYHRQLFERATNHFLKQNEDVSIYHPRLASLFVDATRGPQEDKLWQTSCQRGFSECIFHLIKSEQYSSAADLLCSFAFLLDKLRYGLLDGVLADFEFFRNAAPPELLRQTDTWNRFFHEAAHVLRRQNETWPAHKILLQLAVEYADNSPITEAAERWLAEGHCDWIWLRRAGGRPAHRDADPCINTLEGHRGVIGAGVLTNGRVLSWAVDETLRIWDAQRGACLRILVGHTETVLGASVLPGGRILSWSEDGTLRLWDGQDGISLYTLEGHRKAVCGTQALADGRILSWSEDSTLRLWDGETGAAIATFEGHKAGVKGAQILRDGRILSWSEDATLKMWNPNGGTCLTTLKGHAKTVSGVQTFCDGRILSWSDDSTLKLWDGRCGACLATLEGHRASVSGATALEDGRILSWSNDATLRLWNGQTGVPVQCISLHDSDGRPFAWVKPNAHICPGRPILLCAGGALRLLDLKSGRLLQTLNWRDPVNSARYLSNGWILSWSYTTLQLWDGRDSEPFGTFRGHTEEILGALELNDGTILSWSDDDTLRLWDRRSSDSVAPSDQHTDDVRGVGMLSDGRILSWAEDGTLRIWDDRNGACLLVLKGHSKGVKGALVLSDGRILSWSDDATLRIWDERNGACLLVLKGHTEGVEGALVLSEGRIMSWSWDTTLRIWDGPSGACLHTLKGHTSDVCGARELPDGRILSWATDAARVWDSRNGSCLGILDAGESGIDKAQLLADGDILTTTNDGAMQFWDGQSLNCMQSCSADDTGQDFELLPNDDRFEDCCRVHKLEAVEAEHFRAIELVAPVGDHTFAVWQAGCSSEARRLMPDGSILAAQDDYQVCLLQLYSGNRRLSLADLEQTIPPPPAGTQPRLRYKNIKRFKKLIRISAAMADTDPPDSGPVIPAPNPTCDAQRAAERNMEYQRELAAWKAQPWWDRARTKRPTPPSGI